MRHVAAELVVDVPQPHRRVLPVPLGHDPRHPDRVVAEQRGGDRVGLPTTLAQHRAVGQLWEDLGVAAGRPRRRGRRRRRERDADAGLVQPVQDGVEPLEVVLALARLEHRPGEDRDADQVHPRLLHELDVLELGRQRPLLGVVVTAILDHEALAAGRGWFVGSRPGRGRPRIRSSGRSDVRTSAGAGWGSRRTCGRCAVSGAWVRHTGRRSSMPCRKPSRSVLPGARSALVTGRPRDADA